MVYTVFLCITCHTSSENNSVTKWELNSDLIRRHNSSIFPLFSSYHKICIFKLTSTLCTRSFTEQSSKLTHVFCLRATSQAVKMASHNSTPCRWISVGEKMSYPTFFIFRGRTDFIWFFFVFTMPFYLTPYNLSNIYLFSVASLAL